MELQLSCDEVGGIEACIEPRFGLFPHFTSPVGNAAQIFVHPSYFNF